MIVCLAIVCVITKLSYAENESKEYSSDPKVISVLVGEYVLVKMKDVHAAFRITEAVPNKKGWKYDWVILKSARLANSEFDFDDSDYGAGEVFENYDSIVDNNGLTKLVDKGSKLYFLIGKNISIEWSYPRWIYLPNEADDKKISIIVTKCKNIKDIKVAMFEQAKR